MGNGISPHNQCNICFGPRQNQYHRPNTRRSTNPKRHCSESHIRLHVRLIAHERFSVNLNHWIHLERTPMLVVGFHGVNYDQLCYISMTIGHFQGTITICHIFTQFILLNLILTWALKCQPLLQDSFLYRRMSSAALEKKLLRIGVLRPRELPPTIKSSSILKYIIALCGNRLFDSFNFFQIHPKTIFSYNSDGQISNKSFKEHHLWYLQHRRGSSFHDLKLEESCW